MAKHFIFENTSQYETFKPSLFGCQNRSPSFQEIGYDDGSIDIETENWHMKQKIKELEDNLIQVNEEFLNKDIARIKEFQEKEGKKIREFEVIERKYEKLKWKFEALALENVNLLKQLKDMQDSNKTRESENLFELASKCRFLESQVEYEKNKRKEKIFNYKQKMIKLTKEFQIYCEAKEKFIEELEDKAKKTMKSPIKSSRTPRKNSVNHLQEITNTIQSLEKSQAEYKQKYINLQRSKVASFKEINSLYDILKENEKRLKQAKKLQENIFKTN